jgi:hypothetical protein
MKIRDIAIRFAKAIRENVDAVIERATGLSVSRDGGTRTIQILRNGYRIALNDRPHEWHININRMSSTSFANAPLASAWISLKPYYKIEGDRRHLGRMWRFAGTYVGYVTPAQYETAKARATQEPANQVAA